MKARVKWVEDRTFVGESGTGHRIVLGAAHGPEGRTPGPSAMELVLIGLGGCSAYDVVDILEKGREAMANFRIATFEAVPTDYGEMLGATLKAFPPR